MAARPRRRPGPEPKGIRKQFTVRVPVEQMEIYAREAAAEGYSLGDYLVAALARGHDLPEPAYLHRYRARSQRHELPGEPMLPGTGTTG